MSTKWKYATMPADMRLEMLRSGNDELYKEEIARTKDSISSRLAAGVDVSEQMKWADTVSYNYNLGKAQSMGIDPSNVAKDGYSGKLFGDMKEGVGKNTSSVSSPKNVAANKPYYKEPAQKSPESLRDSVVNSYVRGINKRGNILQEQAREYINSLNDDYKNQIAEITKAYEAKKKNREEALMNEGASENGGRVLSEEIRSEDEYRDIIKSLKDERKKAIAEIKNSLMESLYALSDDMMTKASDEYYRYNALLSEEKKAEYEKERDAIEDNRLWLESSYQKQQDEKSAEERKAALEREIQNDAFERSITEKELALREREQNMDYEKWYKEFEADSKKADRDYYLDSGKLKLDNEKFAYQKEQDGKKKADENAEDEKPSSDQKLYAEKYNKCLEYARKAKYAVKKSEYDETFVPRYTKNELLRMVYAFDLSEEEKRSICDELKLYSN